jgi:hypothetical protein
MTRNVAGRQNNGLTVIGMNAFQGFITRAVMDSFGYVGETNMDTYQTVYKVVSEETHPTNKRKRLFSALVRKHSPSMGLQYFVKRRTAPTIDGTKLFAFGNLEDAQVYSRLSGGRVVYRARGKNVQPSKGWIINVVSNIELLRAFFGGTLFGTPLFNSRAVWDFEPTTDDFTSVVQCDEITLLEKVA